MEENNSQNSNNGLATAGFVVSICSLILNFYGIVGLIGAILSGIGLSKVKTIGKGKGLAIAGLIIGIISIIWGIYSIFTLISVINELTI